MPAPLVLLHGFTQTGASWDRVRSHLRSRTGSEVITPDQRGHGTAATERPILLPAMAADAMSHTTGEFALGGYSMGGRAALLAAVASPGRVSHLALLSTTAGIEDEAEREERAAADAALADHFDELTIEALADEWGAHPLFVNQPADVAELARADRLRNTPDGLAASLRGAGTGKMGPLWPQLRSLTMPALVMVGERDVRFREIGERLAAELPDAEIVVVPGAGHQLPIEAPQQVAEALDALLRR